VDSGPSEAVGWGADVEVDEVRVVDGDSSEDEREGGGEEDGERGVDGTEEEESCFLEMTLK